MPTPENDFIGKAYPPWRTLLVARTYNIFTAAFQPDGTIERILVDKKPLTVTVHLKEQSQPIVHDDVINTYEKGYFYCIYCESEKVYKYPLESIWRIKEDYGYHGRQ